MSDVTTKLVLFIFFIIPNVISQSDDFCGDYEDKVGDVEKVLMGCCKNVFEIDDSKYDVCDNQDKCQEATCILEMDSIWSNGRLNQDAAIRSAMEGKQDKTWSKIIRKVYKFCAKRVTKVDCPPLDFSICMDGKAFVQCPKSEWTNSDSCSEAKRYIESCHLNNM